MEKLCFIKLINGEDIVAIIDNYETDAEEYSICQPLRLHYMQMRNYQVLQFGTWMPFQKDRGLDPYFINKKNVIFIQEADDELTHHYFHAVSQYEEDWQREKRGLPSVEDTDWDEDENLLNMLTPSSNTSYH
jgi:hypothetical protein